MSTSECRSSALVIVTYHDGFLEVAQMREGTGSLYQKLAAVVWLSPEDLRLLGTNEGKSVELSNAVGSIVLQAKSDSDGKPGIAYMPSSLYSLSLTTYDPARGRLPDFKRIEVRAASVSRDVTPISELQEGEIA
jgi:formylmethanofuran dehydrogenase subunit D